MHNYGKAPFWDEFRGFFEQTYNKNWSMLLDLNLHLIRGIMDIFDIHTPLVMASSLGVFAGKSDAVLAKCKKIGAETILCGSGAKVIY